MDRVFSRIDPTQLMIGIHNCALKTGVPVPSAYYDGQSYCKKLHCDGSKTELVSLNPVYKPMPITEETEFRIFGVVLSAEMRVQ